MDEVLANDLRKIALSLRDSVGTQARYKLDGRADDHLRRQHASHVRDLYLQLEKLEQLQQLEPGREAAATRAGRPVRWWWCLCGAMSDARRARPTIQCLVEDLGVELPDLTTDLGGLDEPWVDELRRMAPEAPRWPRFVAD